LSKIKNKDGKTDNAPIQPQKLAQVPTQTFSQNPAPVISLDQALKNEPISFSRPKIVQTPEIKDRIKRKEVNLDELKKVLEESLRKTENNNENPKGV